MDKPKTTTTIIESAVLPVKRVFQMYYKKLCKNQNRNNKNLTLTSFTILPYKVYYDSNIK